MNAETVAKIKELRARGLSVDQIQAELTVKPVVISEEDAEVERDAATVAMERGAIAVAERLLAAVAPGKTFAEMQALPIGRIMAAVDARAATADPATRVALLEDVARLTVLYNALTAHGSNWRSPSFGQASETVPTVTRTEGQSFAESVGDDVPTLHEIRSAL